MVTALVLLNIDRNKIKNVSQKLVDMQEVSEVYSVAGRYDLVAIIRVKNNEQIAETITVKFIIGTLIIVASNYYILIREKTQSQNLIGFFLNTL